jgi:hypothetical protein
MNDERFLKAWLRDTFDSPSDPHGAADKVVAHLPDTPQRRRWLLWPSIRRKRQDHDTTDRRTSLMISPLQAIAAGSLALALGAAFLITQPGVDPGVEVESGAEATGSGETTAFEGTLPYGVSRQTATSETLENAVIAYREQVWEIGTATTSDPRFGGIVSNTWNWDDYPGSDSPTAWTGGWHIENDEGGWHQRPVAQLEFPDGTYSTYTAVFDGVGAYQGLTALVEVKEDNGFTLRGMIFDGELPPPPELLQ